MEDSEKFKKRLLEYFSFTIILDFLVNAYGFSLPIELVILPIITLIALLWTVAKWDKKICARIKTSRGIVNIFICSLSWWVDNRIFFKSDNVQSSWNTREPFPYSNFNGDVHSFRLLYGALWSL